MRIDVRDNNLIVFLNSKKFCDIDFNNKCILENYFRNLFFELNDFGFDMNGSYCIDVFVDDSYGAVLEISKDDVEFYDYCDVVDMKISISKYRGFLFLLKGDIGSLINSCKVYSYCGNIYVEPVDVDFFSYGILLENCSLVYGLESNKIKSNCCDISKCFVD